MELKVLEEKKGRLVFELHGEDATFCNILKDELWNDKTVTAASFRENHPLIKTPILTVEAADPKKALVEAAKRLKKQNADFKKELEKAFK